MRKMLLSKYVVDVALVLGAHESKMMISHIFLIVFVEVRTYGFHSVSFFESSFVEEFWRFFVK
jgi:hypothetical protein